MSCLSWSCTSAKWFEDNVTFRVMVNYRSLIVSVVSFFHLNCHGKLGLSAYFHWSAPWGVGVSGGVNGWSENTEHSGSRVRVGLISDPTAHLLTVVTFFLVTARRPLVKVSTHLCLLRYWGLSAAASLRLFNWHRVTHIVSDIKITSSPVCKANHTSEKHLLQHMSFDLWSSSRIFPNTNSHSKRSHSEYHHDIYVHLGKHRLRMSPEVVLWLMVL